MLNNEAAASEVQSITGPNARTSTFTGSWIDVRGYEGDLIFQLHVGSVTGTTPTLDAVIRQADNAGGSSPTNAPGGAFAQVTASNSLQTIIIPANAVQGWVNLTSTIGGTTPSFTMACTVRGRRKNV